MILSLVNWSGMASVVSEVPKCDPMLVDKLPEVINEMKIKDEKAEKVVFVFNVMTLLCLCVSC